MDKNFTESISGATAEQQLQALLKVREMYLIMKQNIKLFLEDEIFKELEIVAVPTDMHHPNGEPIMKAFKPQQAMEYLEQKIEENTKAIKIAQTGLVIAK